MPHIPVLNRDVSPRLLGIAGGAAAIVLLLALALAAGRNSPDQAGGITHPDTSTSSTTTSTTTTTTTPTTTTTSGPTGPVSPINGLVVEDEMLLARRVLAVKIDNHPNARPQSGIDQADAVVEIRVEGGLTRFIAIFHHSDTDYLGPIRSARPADAVVVRPLDAVLAVSGGQPWIRAGINAIGVPYLSDTRPGMFRIGSRFAPHNLYGDTYELREVAASRDLETDEIPSGWWVHGPLPPGEPVEHVRLVFSDAIDVEWAWDGERYVRTLNGQPSNYVTADGEDSPITAEVLVVIEGHFYFASPPAGQSGSSVPATDTVGEGRVVVFAGGQAVEGTWSRDSAEDPFTLTTSEGETLTVPPGYPWISILPDVGELSWS